MMKNLGFVFLFGRFVVVFVGRGHKIGRLVLGYYILIGIKRSDEI